MELTHAIRKICSISKKKTKLLRSNTMWLYSRERYLIVMRSYVAHPFSSKSFSYLWRNKKNMMGEEEKNQRNFNTFYKFSESRPEFIFNAYFQSSINVSANEWTGIGEIQRKTHRPFGWVKQKQISVSSSVYSFITPYPCLYCTVQRCTSILASLALHWKCFCVLFFHFIFSLLFIAWSSLWWFRFYFTSQAIA